MITPRTRTFAAMLATAATLASSTLAAAAPSPWSQDGSTEAATLRARARVPVAEGPADAENARGIVYQQDPTAPPAPAPAAPAPETPAPPATQPAESDVVIHFREEDFRRSYELERIAKRGRSFFGPGVVLTTVGTLLVIGAIAGIADEANAVTGGLLAGSLAISAVGWPLLVVGVRMRKHPERYLEERRTASIAPGGLTVRF